MMPKADDRLSEPYCTIQSMGRLESLAEQRLLLQPAEDGAGTLFMFARARFPSYNPTRDAAFILQVDLTPPTLCCERGNRS